MAILDDPSFDPSFHRPNPEKVSYAQPALRTGAITAGVLAVIGLVFYVSGLSETMIRWKYGNLFNNVLNFGLMFYFIFVGLKAHRKNDLGGYLSVGRGIGFGSLAGLAAGVISAVWTYIFMNWIAPDMSDTIRQVAMQQMADSGLDEDAIENQMKIVEKFMSPGVIAVFVAVFSAIFGFIIGLISGAILKKE